MKRFFYLSLAVLAVSVSACKKKSTPSPTGPDAAGSTVDKIKDSIFLYAKQTYLWNDALPDYESFNPRGITASSDEAAYAKEVYMISRYKLNPTTGLPFENYVPAPTSRAKYSFIDGGETGAVLAGNGADFGYAISALSATDLRVRYVYAGSAAGNANMHRGDQIITVNGRSGLNIDLDADYNFLINALYTSPMTMTLKRPDNTTYNVSLASSNYTIDPVITYKVFDQGAGKKVGYIVFNSFTAYENASPKLIAAFNFFAANNVSELVVDLRYNGGGRSNTAELLCNLIVPASKNGTMMSTSIFNQTMTSGNADILKNQVFRGTDGKLHNFYEFGYTPDLYRVNFQKQGNVNVNRVFFIVTSGSASASEVAISNLVPHMDVKLIGRTTYGKPVGFYTWKINKYDLYIPQIENVNSTGKANYYTGMVPGSADYPGFNDADDITKDFGDPTERLLGHALNYIKTGTYGTAVRVQASANGHTNEPRMLNDNGFKGIIYDKKDLH